MAKGGAVKTDKTTGSGNWKLDFMEVLFIVVFDYYVFTLVHLWLADLLNLPWCIRVCGFMSSLLLKGRLSSVPKQMFPFIIFPKTSLFS